MVGLGLGFVFEVTLNGFSGRIHEDDAIRALGICDLIEFRQHPPQLNEVHQK